ncbi:hypothetical protein ColLi_09681 [Colletotrichum liriopes]|uniref:Uncharacterized protein n=1 Tax=Colletotrichum liriopes TaxID=708192 RepID=A0AA37GVH3_9PEZI|nr:hypothetical protein ColLi_09681 [Colletotrichum liriopes]
MAKPAEPFDLKILAAGALAFTATDAPATDVISPSTTSKLDHSRSKDGSRAQHELIPLGIGSRELPIRDERSALAAPAVVYSAGDNHAPRRSVAGMSNAEITSPSAPGGLPPLLDSPTSDGSGHGPLPSIRAQLGDFKDFKRLAETAMSPENDLGPSSFAANISS